MKLWEAIFYAILCGLTELTGVSFSGHANLAVQTLSLQPLAEGDGSFLRAALCIGTALAVLLNLRNIALPENEEPPHLPHRSKNRKRGSVRQREKLLLGFGVIPILLGLTVTAKAEPLSWMLLTALFLLLNGCAMYLAYSSPEGSKTARDFTLSDVLLMALGRAAAVLPGLSPMALSLSAGRLCGLTDAYNLRVSFLLTVEGSVIGAVYYLTRGFLAGGFTGAVALAMLLGAALTALTGFFVGRLMCFLFERKKQAFFVYYCWEAAIVAVILALINQ